MSAVSLYQELEQGPAELLNSKVCFRKSSWLGDEFGGVLVTKAELGVRNYIFIANEFRFSFDQLVNFSHSFVKKGRKLIERKEGGMSGDFLGFRNMIINDTFH